MAQRYAANVALAQAKANLGQTVREVAQLFTQEARDAAAVNAQQTLLTQATQDLDRDRAVFAVHGVSDETLKHDEHTVRGARLAGLRLRPGYYACGGPTPGPQWPRQPLGSPQPRAYDVLERLP